MALVRAFGRVFDLMFRERGGRVYFVAAISVALAGLSALLLCLDGNDASKERARLGLRVKPDVLGFRDCTLGALRPGYLSALRALPNLEYKLDVVLELLGVIISDQEHLDADVAALVKVAAAIADEVASLKAQAAAAGVDFTGLDNVVSSLQALVPAVPPTA